MTRNHTSPLRLENIITLLLFVIIGSLALTGAAPFHDGNEIAQATDGCYYNYNTYNEGDRILTNEPCLNCTCHNRMLMCYLRVCPFTKSIGQDCIVEKREDQCCPIVTCPEVPVNVSHPAPSGTELSFPEKFGCSIDNKFYLEGAQVPANPNKPCELCYCIRNRTSCVIQECTLHIDGCTPIYNKGSCCPVRYNCDHENELLEIEDQSTTMSSLRQNASEYLGITTERPSEGFVLTTTLMPTVSAECTHNGEIYADGASVDSEAACEHCYCMRGKIVCAVQECEMAPLSGNCRAVPQEGECCPTKYDCGDNTIEQLTTMSIDNRLSENEAETTTMELSSTDIETTTLSPSSQKDRLPVEDLHGTIPEEDIKLQTHIDDIQTEKDIVKPADDISQLTTTELPKKETQTQTPESDIEMKESETTISPSIEKTGSEENANLPSKSPDKEVEKSDETAEDNLEEFTTVEQKLEELATESPKGTMPDFIEGLASRLSTTESPSTIEPVADISPSTATSIEKESSYEEGSVSQQQTSPKYDSSYEEDSTTVEPKIPDITTERSDNISEENVVRATTTSSEKTDSQEDILRSSTLSTSEVQPDSITTVRPKDKQKEEEPVATISPSENESGSEEDSGSRTTAKPADLDDDKKKDFTSEEHPSDITTVQPEGIEEEHEAQKESESQTTVSPSEKQSATGEVSSSLTTDQPADLADDKDKYYTSEEHAIRFTTVKPDVVGDDTEKDSSSKERPSSITTVQPDDLENGHEEETEKETQTTVPLSEKESSVEEDSISQTTAKPAGLADDKKKDPTSEEHPESITTVQPEDIGKPHVEQKEKESQTTVSPLQKESGSEDDGSSPTISKPDSLGHINKDEDSSLEEGPSSITTVRPDDTEKEHDKQKTEESQTAIPPSEEESGAEEDSSIYTTVKPTVLEDINKEDAISGEQPSRITTVKPEDVEKELDGQKKEVSLSEKESGSDDKISSQTTGKPDSLGDDMDRDSISDDHSQIVTTVKPEDIEKGHEQKENEFQTTVSPSEKESAPEEVAGSHTTPEPASLDDHKDKDSSFAGHPGSSTTVKPEDIGDEDDKDSQFTLSPSEESVSEEGASGYKTTTPSFDVTADNKEQIFISPPSDESLTLDTDDREDHTIIIPSQSEISHKPGIKEEDSLAITTIKPADTDKEPVTSTPKKDHEISDGSIEAATTTKPEGLVKDEKDHIFIVSPDSEDAVKPDNVSIMASGGDSLSTTTDKSEDFDKDITIKEDQETSDGLKDDSEHLTTPKPEHMEDEHEKDEDNRTATTISPLEKESSAEEDSISHTTAKPVRLGDKEEDSVSGERLQMFTTVLPEDIEEKDEHKEKETQITLSPSEKESTSGDVSSSHTTAKPVALDDDKEKDSTSEESPESITTVQPEHMEKEHDEEKERTTVSPSEKESSSDEDSKSHTTAKPADLADDKDKDSTSEEHAENVTTVKPDALEDDTEKDSSFEEHPSGVTTVEPEDTEEEHEAQKESESQTTVSPSEKESTSGEVSSSHTTAKPADLADHKDKDSTFEEHAAHFTTIKPDALGDDTEKDFSSEEHPSGVTTVQPEDAEEEYEAQKESESQTTVSPSEKESALGEVSISHTTAKPADLPDDKDSTSEEHASHYTTVKPHVLEDDIEKDSTSKEHPESITTVQPEHMEKEHDEEKEKEHQTTISPSENESDSDEDSSSHTTTKPAALGDDKENEKPSESFTTVQPEHMEKEHDEERERQTTVSPSEKESGTEEPADSLTTAKPADLDDDKKKDSSTKERPSSSTSTVQPDDIEKDHEEETEKETQTTVPSTEKEGYSSSQTTAKPTGLDDDKKKDPTSEEHPESITTKQPEKAHDEQREKESQTTVSPSGQESSPEEDADSFTTPVPEGLGDEKEKDSTFGDHAGFTTVKPEDIEKDKETQTAVPSSDKESVSEEDSSRQTTLKPTNLDDDKKKDSSSEEHAGGFTTVKPDKIGEEHIGDSESTVIPSEKESGSEDDTSSYTTVKPESSRDEEKEDHTSSVATGSDDEHKPISEDGGLQEKEKDDMVTITPVRNEIPQFEKATVIPDSDLSEPTSPNDLFPQHIPGEGECLYQGVTYSNNSEIPSPMPCVYACSCKSSVVICDKMKCRKPYDPKSECYLAEEQTDKCCPQYVCPQNTEFYDEQPQQMSKPLSHVKDDVSTETPKEAELEVTTLSLDEIEKQTEKMKLDVEDKEQILTTLKPVTIGDRISDEEDLPQEVATTPDASVKTQEDTTKAPHDISAKETTPYPLASPTKDANRTQADSDMSTPTSSEKGEKTDKIYEETTPATEDELESATTTLKPHGINELDVDENSDESKESEEDTTEHPTIHHIVEEPMATSEKAHEATEKPQLSAEVDKTQIYDTEGPVTISQTTHPSFPHHVITTISPVNKTGTESHYTTPVADVYEPTTTTVKSVITPPAPYTPQAPVYGQPPQYPSYPEDEYSEEEEPEVFGPGTCRYGGKLYVSAQQIPRDDPCDFCFCFRSDIICLQQSCPPPIMGCHEEPISGFCCPRYECPVSMATVLNISTSTTTTSTTLPPHFLHHSYGNSAQRGGCLINGRSYTVGQHIESSSGPCISCTCGGDGKMKCDPQTCMPEPTMQQVIELMDGITSRRR